MSIVTKSLFALTAFLLLEKRNQFHALLDSRMKRKLSVEVAVEANRPGIYLIMT